MPFTPGAKDVMLNAFGTDADFVSLHTAYPGNTGASEVSGGSPAYARKAMTFAASSAGTMAGSATPTFDVPAATTIYWLGHWDAVTTGNFRGYEPLGGTPFRYTCNTGTDTFTVVSHGYSNGDQVVFFNGTSLTGLTTGTAYFVVSASTDTFQVSATLGGAAIDVSGTFAAASRVSKVVPETYGSQGTAQLVTSSFNLLDT